MRKIAVGIGLAVLMLLITVVATTAAPRLQTVSPPGRMTYQGHLMDDAGLPVPDGDYVMTFSLYDAPTDGDLLWGPENQLVGVDDGYFSALLGGDDEITPDDLESETYLEITVSGETMTPRHRLASVPFALVAQTCISGSGTISGTTDGWALTGNAGTDPETDYIGTSDDTPLVIAVNGLPAMGIFTNAIMSVVGGNTAYVISSTGSLVSICGGVDNAADGEGAVVAGGTQNTSTDAYATISGGAYNSALALYATIGGGFQNLASNGYTTIGGGQQNWVYDYAGTIGGGFSNLGGPYVFIGGGANNRAANNYAVVGGGYSNVVSGTYATICGGRINIVSNTYGTVGGGYQNLVSADYGTVGGGYSNTVSAGYGVVGGGWQNVVSGTAAVVGGGYENAAGGVGATIAGGNENTTSDNYATVGGGEGNTVSGQHSTISGGNGNDVSGWNSTIPGGRYNTVVGQVSLASGQYATAGHDGVFVWNDFSGSSLSSSADNQFLVRASGGITMYTGASAGATLPAGSGSWSSLSDRDAKTNITPVNAQDVLDRLSRIEVSQWSYTASTDTLHIGPMAQDFYAAFGVGDDAQHISTVDADGVSLAAIQALLARVEALEARVAELERRCAR